MTQQVPPGYFQVILYHKRWLFGKGIAWPKLSAFFIAIVACIVKNNTLTHN
jgi:hypothetical protein